MILINTSKCVANIKVCFEIVWVVVWNAIWEYMMMNNKHCDEKMGNRDIQ